MNMPDFGGEEFEVVSSDIHYLAEAYAAQALNEEIRFQNFEPCIESCTNLILEPHEAAVYPFSFSEEQHARQRQELLKWLGIPLFEQPYDDQLMFHRWNDGSWVRIISKPRETDSIHLAVNYGEDKNVTHVTLLDTEYTEVFTLMSRYELVDFVLQSMLRGKLSNEAVSNLELARMSRDEKQNLLDRLIELSVEPQILDKNAGQNVQKRRQKLARAVLPEVMPVRANKVKRSKERYANFLNSLEIEGDELSVEASRQYLIEREVGERKRAYEQQLRRLRIARDAGVAIKTFVAFAVGDITAAIIATEHTTSLATGISSATLGGIMGLLSQRKSFLRYLDRRQKAPVFSAAKEGTLDDQLASEADTAKLQRWEIKNW